MTTTARPSGQEIIGWMKSLSNWGRWGAQDDLGTLNYITPEKRAAAARLVRKGITVTTSRPMFPQMAPDNIHMPQHFLSVNAPAKGMGAATDHLSTGTHGYNITHIDALCHLFWDGKSYNGLEASQVTSFGKASRGGIEVIEDGVVTRGVLLDIAGLKGKEHMEAGEGIFPEDLEAAEKAQGVRVEKGDALLYRTGWAKARVAKGPAQDPNPRPGLNVACLPWLHERGVALIGADAATDVVPHGYGNDIPFAHPVHEIGICAMGLWILDGADYEKLAGVCRQEGRWEFQWVMAPLRWKGATGVPVNPLAIL